MYKKLIRILLKEIDDSGELKSLSSCYESTRLDVLSVVKIVESRQCVFFKNKRYIPTQCKLQDLLRSTDTLDFGGFQEDSVAAVCIKETFVGKAGVQISGSSLCQTETTGQVLHANSTTDIKLKRKSIRRPELSKSSLDKTHFLFEEMENNRRILGLGVVYEVMKNKNPVTLEQATKVEGSAKILFIKVASMLGGCAVDHERQVEVPADCVLGFKVYPFHLKPKEDSTVRRFKGADDSTLRHRITSDGLAEFAAEMPGNFPRLKRLVEAELRDFIDMDQSVKELVWEPLDKMLKCPQDLYELDCMLAEGRFITDAESVQNLLRVVGVDESSESSILLRPIGSLVSASSELGKEAVSLIVDLDGKTRGQVLKLVEGVLEQVYSRDGRLPPMSGQYSENAMKMATQVLTSCGLAVAEDSLDPSLGSPGSPDVTLLALYITLKGLDMLLGS